MFGHKAMCCILFFSWFCAILDYVQESGNGAELQEFVLVKDTVNTSSNLNSLVSEPSVSGLCFLCSSSHRIFVQKKSLESAQRQWH